jgi:ubiquinone biosynthesis UbiH/UbiF/VisC/COQ6 family hydroxylase
MKTPSRIVIVGAGPVGLAVAAGLSEHLPASSSIHLLDAGAAPAVPSIDAPWDMRVFAASRASQRFLSRIGAWTRIPSGRIQPYTGMRVWEEAAELRFDAGDLGVADLGHIVENTWIRAAIFGEIARKSTISCMFETKLDAVVFDGDRCNITTDAGTVLSADLLVAADGANSTTRHLAGLSESVLDHCAQAVVCHLSPEDAHGGIARQRFLPTGPLALLPLADGRVSLVWSNTNSEAEALISMDEPGFSAAVSEASAFALGHLEATTVRQSFPLRSMTSDEPHRHGLVLVGDAAHTVHPLAGQGMNLGLLDAAALVEVVSEAVAAGESPGALRTLRRFHRRRDQHNSVMQRAFGLIDRAFRADGTVLKLLRKTGLVTADRVAPLRRFLVRQAMGLDGDLPSMMRVETDAVGPDN